MSESVSQNTIATNRKRRPLKLIRVMEEKKLEIERENRVKTAFTFGLKLHNGLPDRY